MFRLFISCHCQTNRMSMTHRSTHHLSHYADRPNILLSTSQSPSANHMTVSLPWWQWLWQLRFFSFHPLYNNRSANMGLTIRYRGGGEFFAFFTPARKQNFWAVNFRLMFRWTADNFISDFVVFRPHYVRCHFLIYSGQHIFHKFRQQTCSTHIFNKLLFPISVATNLFLYISSLYNSMYFILNK